MSLSSLLEASVRGSLESAKTSRLPAQVQSSRGVGAKGFDVNADRLSRCGDAIVAFRADNVLSVMTTGRFVVRPPASLVQYTSKTRFDHPAQESMIRLKSPLLRTSVIKLSYTSPPPPPRKPPVRKPAAPAAVKIVTPAPVRNAVPATAAPAVNSARPAVAQADSRVVRGLRTPASERPHSDSEITIIGEVPKNKVIGMLDLEPMEDLSSGEDDFLDNVPECKPSDKRCATCVTRSKIVMVGAETQCDISVERHSVETQTGGEMSDGSLLRQKSNDWQISRFNNLAEQCSPPLNNPSLNTGASSELLAEKKNVFQSNVDKQKNEVFQMKIAELSMQYEMFKASLSGAKSAGTPPKNTSAPAKSASAPANSGLDKVADPSSQSNANKKCRRLPRRERLRLRMIGDKDDYMPPLSGVQDDSVPQSSSMDDNIAVKANEPLFKQSFQQVSDAFSAPSMFGGGFLAPDPAPHIQDPKQYAYQLHPYNEPASMSVEKPKQQLDPPTFSTFGSATSFPSQSLFIQPPGLLKPPFAAGPPSFHLPLAAFGPHKNAPILDPFNMGHKGYGPSNNQSTRGGKW